MGYTVVLITTDEASEIYSKIKDNRFITAKADIAGVCVRLYTEDRETVNMWRDNFYPMINAVRSHARIFCISDCSGELKVLYDRNTKTAFLYNFDYYGWIKSIALAMASDILEDAHKVYSVHGAALDIDGKGVTLIAPSKTGKTTQSWGLIRTNNAHLITDDWFFVRLTEGRPRIHSSEKNCYIDADIGDVWEEYTPLVTTTKFDNKGRGIANLRWIMGQDSMVSTTSMRDVILLKRDKADDRIIIDMTADEALDYLVEHDFCCPHQMVRDDGKLELRKEFFRRFLSRCSIHMVNTVLPAKETQAKIREALGVE